MCAKCVNSHTNIHFVLANHLVCGNCCSSPGAQWGQFFHPRFANHNEKIWGSPKWCSCYSVEMVHQESHFLMVRTHCFECLNAFQTMISCLKPFGPSVFPSKFFNASQDCWWVSLRCFCGFWINNRAMLVRPKNGLNSEHTCLHANWNVHIQTASGLASPLLQMTKTIINA